MNLTKTVYAVALCCVASLDTHATLITVDNGLGVYSSISNVTYTADANLLGTMEIQQGTLTVIHAIIAANGGSVPDTPNFSNFYSNTHTLSDSDFNGNINGWGLGTANWFGAQAFMNYLNSINYGNSNQWALPTTPDSNLSIGNNQSDSPLSQLFYQELGGVAGNTIPASTYFINEKTYAYWSDTEHASYPAYAWIFHTNDGYQNNDSKVNQIFVWAVSPGQVSSVPVPSAVWLFGSGLVGLLGLKRRC